MMKGKEIVAGIGEALWDILPEGKKMGGGPANFAYHVGQFGLDSCVISAIGEDDLGIELSAEMKEKDIAHVLERVPYRTGTVEVELDNAGVPQYDIKENVAWDNIPWSERIRELAEQTRAVCFGTLAQRNVVSRETIGKFLDEVCKDRERLVVFDVNLRQHFYNREVIENSLRRCNILKINDEELVILSRMLDYEGLDMEAICRGISSDYDMRMLILTCGVRGSYVFADDEVSFEETPRVKVADTVGAGDSFTGAFIANILKGKSVKDAHRTAVKTSAFVCTQQGGMPKLPREITET